MSTNLYAQEIRQGRLSITEEDGSPEVYPWQIKFANTNVTDNADGTVSIGGGTGDVTDVGDCASGACLDGTSDGGTYIKFYDPQGAGTFITGNLTGAVTWTLPTTGGTLIHTETDPTVDTSAEIQGILGAASSGVNGYLLGTDWDTFNGKMAGTLAKDIVAGVGLSGGEDNVLPGADADTTLTVDATELDALTWDAGTLTNFTWTFDLSGTDVAINWTSAKMDVTGTVNATALTEGGVAVYNDDEIDTYSEINAIVADVTLTHNGLIDTFAELDAIVADASLEKVITAGRSLTKTLQDIEADAELYTDCKCAYIEDPVAADDLKSIWYTPVAVTLTKIWAESDQTVTFMLQVDDGTPADVDSVDLSPAAGTATDTALNGDTTMAAGDRLDIDLVSVANTPTWVSICFEFTRDD